MQHYETPAMQFVQLNCGEKISHDNCWKANSFHFDDPTTCEKEAYVIKVNGKCNHNKGVSVFLQMLQHIKGWCYCGVEFPSNNSKNGGISLGS